MRLSSFLHTVKWFQVWLYNSHNLTSVICLHTVCSIWFIDRTLSGTNTQGQSRPGSNDNEGVLHIPQSSKAFHGLLHFTLDMYLIMLTVKQGGIKYHFFWVFGMTQPGIERQSPGLIRSMVMNYFFLKKKQCNSKSFEAFSKIYLFN